MQSKLESKLVLHSLTHAYTLTHACNTHITEPPYFVAWPRDTRVLVGSSFNLSCSTEAHSHGHNDTAPPTLEWRFGNRTLPPHSVAQLPASAHLDCSSYTARAERRVSAGSMIVVQRAELNDTGVYHCMAANRHGSVTAVASVRVLST